MVRLICKELSRPIIIVSHMSQPLNKNFKYKLQTRTSLFRPFLLLGINFLSYKSAQLMYQPCENSMLGLKCDMAPPSKS